MLKALPAFILLLFFFSCSQIDQNKELSQEENDRLDSLLISGIVATQELRIEDGQRLLDSLIGQAELTGSAKHIVLGYLNLGNLYNYYSFYDQALENLFIALEKSEEYGLERYTNSILNNIGIAYSRNGSHDKASEYFDRALTISRADSDTFRIATNLINLSNTLTARDFNDSALICLEEASVLYLLINDSSNYRAGLNNIGNVYNAINEGDSALHYYTKAYQGSSTLTNPWLRWEFALNLARSHFAINQLDSSKIYLEEAILGFRKGNDTENLISAYRLKSQILKDEGSDKEALALLERNLSIQDSLISAQASNWISKHQLNYEFGKKEKEVYILEAEAKRRQTFWIFGSIFLIVFVVLLWQLMRSRVTRLNQENLLLEKEKNLTNLRLEKNLSDQKRMEEEHVAREKISTIEKQRLQQEIDFKNRSLVSKVLNLSNQNDQMAQILNLLEGAEDLEDQDINKVIEKSKAIIKSQQNLENDWESIKVHFEEVHPNFFNKLNGDFKDLNSNDLRMCAYLVLDLSPKEIANILNIESTSVRKRKQRLKEKLGISKEQELNEWLRNNYLNQNRD